MRLTEKKLNSLKVSMQAYLPDNYINYRISSDIKPEELEISDIVWIELFSGDLLPEDLIDTIKKIKNIVAAYNLEHEEGYRCYFDAYIAGLETKKYLQWSYADLSRAADKYPECKKLLEEIL